MKRALLTLIALLMFTAPLSASAKQCCLQDNSSYCQEKTSGTACPIAFHEVDCNSAVVCSNYYTSCCDLQITKTDGTIKHSCIEINRDEPQNCVSAGQGQSAHVLERSCSDLVECNQPAPVTPPPPGPETRTFEAITPNLQVNIPGLELPDVFRVKSDGTTAYIPFIAVYFAALYKFAVGAAAVLAVIFVMLGGFVWLTAGGSTDRIAKAKSMISNAVVGLFIAVGSYTVLSIINPDLVNFNALAIPLLGRQEFETYEKTPEDRNVSGNLSKTELDDIFKAYASCTGIDWRILKAMAAAESGLNPSDQTPNGKYQGLFQESVEYCQDGIGPYASFLSCSNRFDAEANTAAALTHVDKNMKRIIAACPTATLKQQILILYVGHNNGPAVMNKLLAAHACDEEAQRLEVRKFYDTCNGKTPCDGKVKTVDANWGERKWKYGEKIANNASSLGATTAYPEGAQSLSTCPSTTQKRVKP